MEGLERGCGEEVSRRRGIESEHVYRWSGERRASTERC